MKPEAVVPATGLVDNKGWSELGTSLDQIIGLRGDAAAVAQEIGTIQNRLEKEGGISKFVQRTTLSLKKMGPEKSGPIVRELLQAIKVLELMPERDLIDAMEGA